MFQEDISRFYSLIPVLGSHMSLIPALERLRQEGIWNDRERNIKWEESGGQCIKPENSVEVRTSRWLLCFSDSSAFTNIPDLGFYY